MLFHFVLLLPSSKHVIKFVLPNPTIASLESCVTLYFGVLKVAYLYTGVTRWNQHLASFSLIQRMLSYNFICQSILAIVAFVLPNYARYGTNMENITTASNGIVSYYIGIEYSYIVIVSSYIEIIYYFFCLFTHRSSLY